MSDIVERLRKVERVERELAHDWDMPPEGTANWEYAETCREAADEIDRLRAALREIMGMDEVALVEFKKGDGWLHQRVARAALVEKAGELDRWGDIYGDNAAAAIRALKER